MALLPTFLQLTQLMHANCFQTQMSDDRQASVNWTQLTASFQYQAGGKCTTCSAQGSFYMQKKLARGLLGNCASCSPFPWQPSPGTEHSTYLGKSVLTAGVTCRCSPLGIMMIHHHKLVT